MFVNEFGVTTVIFNNLIRAEFHFHAISEVTIAQAWRGQISFPRLDASLLVDKSGKLTPYLEPLIGPPPDRSSPENVQFIVNCFINWALFGHNVLRRGEYARALELLGILQRHLLWMVRILEAKTGHWPTPSRLLERDLSAEANTRFKACAAPLEQEALWHAYRAAWSWGREMIGQLALQHNLKVPESLCTGIDCRMNDNADTNGNHP
jgi:lincosamide nucleotidyltransferase B/F